MGAREFQAACEDESGQNLEWFFDQWVRSNRYLSYDIESKETARRDGMYVSRVKVKCGGTLRMPVPVEASFEDGTKMLRFTDRLADSTELVFESASPLAKVEIDPLGQLPLVVPPLDAGAKAVGEKIAALAWTGSGAEAHELFPRAKSANITDMDTWFKLAFALYDGKYYDEAMEAWHRVAELDKNPVRIFAALVWQGHMADLLGRREEALAFYTEALKRDPGFPIRHDQYGMKVGREWVEERLKEPFKRPEPPR
jgi:tetratricopeptide (TPR) repeat protein